MARSFSELEARMSPEALARSDARYSQLRREMALNELREARRLTQQQLASVLHVDQGSVSKLERRADMYVSTLRSYVEAMGGRLEISAVFPDGKVHINQFAAVEESE